MDRLKDKTALITVSSRGIGAAIAALFAREGAKVALHGRDTQALSAVLADIAQAGGEASFVTGDTTKFSDIEAMRHQIERDFGPVDILVANAGGSFTTPGSIEQTREEEWRASIDGKSHRDLPHYQELSARHEGAQNRKHHHIVIGRCAEAAPHVPHRICRG
jgi:3-oxoacyl-[acyl-carrier protein] reductase